MAWVVTRLQTRSQPDKNREIIAAAQRQHLRNTFSPVMALLAIAALASAVIYVASSLPYWNRVSSHASAVT